MCILDSPFYINLLRTIIWSPNKSALYDFTISISFFPCTCINNVTENFCDSVPSSKAQRFCLNECAVFITFFIWWFQLLILLVLLSKAEEIICFLFIILYFFLRSVKRLILLNKDHLQLFKELFLSPYFKGTW